MASKRKFKKALEDATDLLYQDMMLEALFTKNESKADEIGKLMAKLVSAYEVARTQASVKFDKTAKAFDTEKEYTKARRAFYRQMFERIASDYNKVLNECIEKFKSLMEEKAA